MGLLKGLLRARKLLLIILVPLLLLPLPVLHPSSVSTGLSPRPHPPGRWREWGVCQAQRGFLLVERSGNAFLEEADILSA